MPVSMFTTNTESVNSSDSAATTPRPTRIESSAISTGTSPPTTAPNTSISTTSAAGRPMASSPFSRSRCDCTPKSLSALRRPVIETVKPLRPLNRLHERHDRLDGAVGRDDELDQRAWWSAETSWRLPAR